MRPQEISRQATTTKAAAAYAGSGTIRPGRIAGAASDTHGARDEQSDRPPGVARPGDEQRPPQRPLPPEHTDEKAERQRPQHRAGRMAAVPLIAVGERDPSEHVACAEEREIDD